MPAGSFVAYYRVSTQRQGRSGLGLEAQKKAVTDYLNGGQWRPVGEFMEVESGKRADNRPELNAALATCRLHGATLIIAKLDRLSRDAHFLLGLQKAGVSFVAADMPDANHMTVGIMALVAQHEREAISRRTREALAAAKARGRQLGNPGNLANQQLGSVRGNAVKAAKAAAWAADLAPTLARLQEAGITNPQAIAKALTAEGIPTPRKKPQWSAVQVSRVLGRVDRL